MSAKQASKAQTKRAAAGGGSPGTTDTSERDRGAVSGAPAPETGAEPTGAAAIDPAAEAAAADVAAQAEALTPPGGNVAELLGSTEVRVGGLVIPGKLGERADDAHPGEALTFAEPVTLEEAVRLAHEDGTLSHLHVRALPEYGFRRAGRFWPPGEGVTVFAGNFDAEQVQALLTEPQLVVTPVFREWAAPTLAADAAE